MQNLVLAVQNTVQATDIGTASASVAFFRSVGGAIGVSVLGAILGNRVKELAVEGLAAANIPVQGDSAGASMDLKDLPGPIREIMRAAYGDATAQIFLISAIIGLVAFVAILFIKERPLRRTVDIRPEEPVLATDPEQSADPEYDLDREFVEVLGGHHADRPRTPGFEHAMTAGGAGRDAAMEEPPARARTMLAEARVRSGFGDAPDAGTTDSARVADVVPLLQQTQQLLAEQQLQLTRALVALHRQAEEQHAVAAEQARISAELAGLRRQLAKERKLQRAAADYIATHGKHRSQ
jgi:hypothetical protein